MGFDVLDDLVASGHLSQEVRDSMPTHSMPVLEWRQDRDGFGVKVSGFGIAEGDCHQEYRCMIDPNGPECQ